MDKPTRFNVRVYSIIFNETEDSVLVADELIYGKPYTKFPGGGLEFGEGIVECVHREAQEELGQSVRVIEHFYTTDFFLRSAFRSADQVISIYYRVALDEKPNFRISEKKFDFKQNTEDEESFRWVKLKELHPDDFEFAADKEVVKKLQLNFES